MADGNDTDGAPQMSRDDHLELARGHLDEAVGHLDAIRDADAGSESPAEDAAEGGERAEHGSGPQRDASGRFTAGSAPSRGLENVRANPRAAGIGIPHLQIRRPT